ncbi:hypothetical protein BDDG_07494 [Blastomyces dermatitidis ATCC 18188]|uniref:Uncharacterized protein n=1 Tax=Ajellomyces dermatitidis (strain ATCC 18188 / CBS 674.68) TaxID=653446 RepID=F2TMT6_AJEDA|nr:hypothetical protein BDDG_07494 [Blastomyces dermatitidis ATCC 18188]
MIYRQISLFTHRSIIALSFLFHFLQSDQHPTMTPMTTCPLEICFATTALGKPWERIDGKSYNQEETGSREQFETSSRLSPSTYNDAKVYFMEFCKALLIIKKCVSEDIGISDLMQICMDENYALYLIKEHLRFIAHYLECHSSSEDGQVPPNRWHIFLARAQNLWKSDVRSWPGVSGLSWSGYHHLIMEVADEFRLRQ